MSKEKYEICQKTSDGKWEIIAWSPNYNNVIKVADALEFLDGKGYAIYQDGEFIRSIGKTT